MSTTSTSEHIKRIPVILDTDIGGDIDDTWALGMLLKSPELDVKLITTTTGDTVYRARIVARFLELAGRTDIPIGIGLRNPGDKVWERQAPWVKDYQIEDYPGVVHQDGVQALINTIFNSSEPISIICIGPLPNIAEAMRHNPHIVENTRFVGMHGSFHQHHAHNAFFNIADGAIPEWNVLGDIASAKTVFSGKWREMTITPIDTCGHVVLEGEPYRRIRESQVPMIRAIVENYDIWAQGHPEFQPQAHSTVLFDTVAVYLAYSTQYLRMERLGVRIDDQGYTISDPQAQSVNVAMQWENLDAYKEHLVNRLLFNGNPSPPASAPAEK